MAKKRKRAYKKRTITQKTILPNDELKIERALIENFVSLQKVMVNLSDKFDNLTGQISKLLNLFEISAKVLAEKDFDTEGNKKDNAKIIEILENIIDQNRTIARGLTLMHDKISGPQNYPSSDLDVTRTPIQKLPIRSFSRVPRATISQRNEGEYHKSISSNEQKTQ
ncbi:MAG: hypothetical protein ABIE36_03325 [Candidatus Diapherotrites archaeon]